MSDEPAPDSTEQVRNEHSPAGATDQETGAPSKNPQAWGREDRNRLFIWVGISFLLPASFLYGLHVLNKQHGSAFSVQSELPAKAIMAFFVILGTWIVSRIEKRPLDNYGIPLRQALGRRFWEGCVWGFAMLSTVLLILRALGHFQIDSAALTGGAILRYALGWGVTFLAVSLSEEFAFRGYWLFSFSRRMGFWPAALFISAVFGAAHLGNHGENVLGILQVVAIGLILCLSIRRTGSLWFAVGFHAAWDWAETFFYGTPDSGLLGAGRFLNTSVSGPNWLTGGSAGPEGSVIVYPVFVLLALLIHLRFPKAIYPDRPR
jgi:membrane protease YdiL (CAAX protease family)